MFFGKGKVSIMTKVCSEDLLLEAGSVSVHCVCSSRERDHKMVKDLARLQRRSRGAWKVMLSERHIRWLRLIVKKTTNAQRQVVFTNGDPRGLRGYLTHVGLSDMPRFMRPYMLLTNSSINQLLRTFPP